MKVAFDASTAAFRQKTGTGVYVDEFIRAYQRRFTGDKIIHTYRLSRRVKGRQFLLPVTDNVTRETLLEPWTFFKGVRYDIFHGLNSRLPLLAGSKMVATVHDVFSIYGEFAEVAFREDQTRKLRQMIERSHHIIVPAHYTGALLIDKMGVDPRKVSCVGLGVRDLFLKPRAKSASFQIVTETYKIQNPYFLFVGALEKRKNLIGCVRAYAKYRKLYPEHKVDLVLVGHPGYKYDEIRQEIDTCGYGHSIKIVGFVADDHLADLYRACEALLFLSLEEGYGIPIIEAMACGAPVVSSDTTSLPEVGGGFTWLVPAHEPEAAARALREVCSPASAVVEKIRAGQRYAQLKTWVKVAEQTRQVYLPLMASAQHHSPS